MIIQGPLTLNWRRRKFGLFPRIENSEISGTNPATKERIDLWIKQEIHIKGKEDWIFIKAHCHGTQEPDHGALLGKKADNMYSYLEKKYNDGIKFKLHYVTARECYNIVKAAESGESGKPNKYRNYTIKKYKSSVN